jgi:subtilisin family serine protease
MKLYGGNEPITNSFKLSISGTSMASPHVAGLAAYLLGLGGKQSPAAIGQKIKDLATKSAVKISGTGTATTPNLLAFNGASS